MMKKFDNFLFDFDDTLVNSGKMHEKAFKKTIRKFNNELSKNINFQYENLKGLKTVDALKKIGFKKKLTYLTNYKKKKYREDINKVRFFPYVTKLINFLRKNDKKIFIVSGSSRKNISFLFSKINFLPDGIISSEDCDLSKPNKKPYELCILKYKLKRKKTIAIEDSINGILSAKLNNISTLGIYNKKTNVYSDFFYENIKKFYTNLIV